VTTSGEPAVRLRAATGADRLRIRAWLAAPDAAASWPDRASAEAEITLALESDGALCRILEAGADAIGYAHAADARLWGAAAVPDPATFAIAYVLAPAADPDALGAALALLAGEVFATRLALACSAAVSVRQEVAVRGFEKAGFHWHRIAQDPRSGPAWLMLKRRPRPQG
jgi:aminoglycoside 6'-N-acetyltransferase